MKIKPPSVQDQMHRHLEERYQSERYQLLFAIARGLGRSVLEYRAPGWDGSAADPAQTWGPFQRDPTYDHRYSADEACGWYSTGAINFVGLLVVPRQDLPAVTALMHAHPTMEYRWLIEP